MKTGFTYPYLLSPLSVSFSVLGVLLGRFSSVLHSIRISEIPAKAGALQQWREPNEEVSWLAAKSSERDLINGAQDAEREEASSAMGSASCKLKPRLRP